MRHEIFAGAMPGDLMALTLAMYGITPGRAIILAQAASTAPPSHLQGMERVNERSSDVLPSYDQRTGDGSANPQCYRLPAYLKEVNASARWAGDAEWMHHKIDAPEAVRYSALFPAFEAEAMSP